MQRQQFEIQGPPTIDLHSYRVRSQGRCPPIFNLLIIGSSLGLFAYVNTYFLVNVADVINGQVFDQQTQTFDCNSYYCDQTAYNFIYFYSNYAKCNARNCATIICEGYDCNNYENYDINYFYACQPNCGDMKDQPLAPSAMTAYIMGIVTACFFGVGVLINLVYGIGVNFCTKGLTPMERAGLVLGFTWPKLKYYAFRNRVMWDNFDLNFKPMIVAEMIINVCYAVTLSLYIYLEIAGFWQTGPQIANFYMFIWAYVSRVTMVGEVSSPFCKADRELFQLRNTTIYST